MNRAKLFRRCAALGLMAVATSTGCASMKPSEWFGSNPEPYSLSEPPGFGESIANTGKGISGQFKSMGTAVQSAYSKTKEAVTSPFRGKEADPGDPTSLSHMPKNLGPEIWVTNGQLYESQGNFGKALDNYTKALELEPSNEAALLSTARLYARQQQHAQSATFFEKALAIKPEAATFNELALAFQQQGKTVDAQQAVKKAINLDPSNARYRNNLAGMLVAEGRSGDAVKELEQVFSPAVANYNVAYLHYSNQNMAGAQQHLSTALQIDPKLAQARDLMAQVGGSPAGQTAMAAYQSAGNIYRTAQATAQAAAGAPTVPANQAVYQKPAQ